MTISTLIKRGLALGAAAAALAVVAAAPASAASKDRNHDQIPDRWEVRHGLSLEKNQAPRDQDRDGLRNRGEFRAKFDPRNNDSDDDGVPDGEEGAGTVASFDATTGILVIDLFNGDSISGLVDDQTEIECENDDDVEPDHGGPGTENEDENEDENGDESENEDEGENSGPGNARAARDDDNEGEQECTVDNLTPGTIVHEAELKLTASGAVFEEIEL